MSFSKLCTYPKLKRYVQTLFDDLKQRELFLFNDENTVISMTQNIWQTLDKTKKSVLNFSIYITPHGTSGVLALIASDDCVKKAAMISLGSEMYDLLHTTKEEQLECLDKYWKISTTQALLRKVIQYMLDNPHPSFHIDVLTICLENIHLLPDQEKYFAFPTFIHLDDETCVICWFVQKPDTEDTAKIIRTELIEIARIPSCISDGQLINSTIDVLVANVIQINKKMR